MTDSAITGKDLRSGLDKFGFMMAGSELSQKAIIDHVGSVGVCQ